MRFGFAHAVALTWVSALALAPAMAQTPRTFTVHFAENDSKVVDEDRKILGVAIEAAQDCEQVQVQLIGHDDGPTPQETSLKRIEAVRDMMINDGGINQSGFKTEARGAKQLAVPAARSASDRANRRVEINITCK